MSKLKYVLGGIVDTGNYEAMSLVSLYSSLLNNADFDEVRLVISPNTDPSWKELVCKLHRNVTLIERSDFWEQECFQFFKGSKATYWKFQLIDSLKSDEMLIFIDTDAFCFQKLPLKTFEELLTNNPQETTLLGVATPRPMFERFPVVGMKSPMHYINAGFFVTIKSSFKLADVVPSCERVRKLDNHNLVWHDQDLLNEIFASKIGYLPLSFNISTGMLKVSTYGPNKLNVFSLKEAKKPHVLHASGGVLFFKANFYPFRDQVIDLINKLESHLEKNMIKHSYQGIAIFKQAITRSFLSQLIYRTFIFLGYFDDYEPSFYNQHWHIRKLFQYKTGLKRRILNLIMGN